jgi:hypothetical protein
MRSVSSFAIASIVGLSAACAPEGSSAYVSRNVDLTADCTPDDSGSVGIATGVWDIGSTKTDANCVHSYQMNLVVNSSLIARADNSIGRAEPNVLQITHADITLKDKNQGTLVFKGANGAVDSTRPNPYRVLTAATLPPSTSSTPETAVVQIEAIPRVYADKLSPYAGQSIIVEVQVFGTTTGDVDVDFRPFDYPLSLCAGCYSYCKKDFVGRESDATTLTSGKCVDNSAQDERICIDPGC